MFMISDCNTIMLVCDLGPNIQDGGQTTGSTNNFGPVARMQLISDVHTTGP